MLGVKSFLCSSSSSTNTTTTKTITSPSDSLTSSRFSNSNNDNDNDTSSNKGDGVAASPSVTGRSIRVTRPATRVFGRFLKLKQIRHPHICRYIAIERGRFDRIYLVSEHFSTTLWSKCWKSRVSEGEVLRYGFQIARGLNFLHERGIIHGNLTLDNVLVDSKNNIKLSDYGMHYLTGEGSDVSFVIGTPEYWAPEGLGDGSKWKLKTVQTDVWSFGICLLRLVAGCFPWPSLRSGAATHQVLSGIVETVLQASSSMIDLPWFERFMQSVGVNEAASLKDLFVMCLHPDPCHRCLMSAMLLHSVFVQDWDKCQLNMLREQQDAEAAAALRRCRYELSGCDVSKGFWIDGSPLIDNVKTEREQLTKQIWIETPVLQCMSRRMATKGSMESIDTQSTTVVPSGLTSAPASQHEFEGLTLDDIFYLWKKNGGDLSLEIDRLMSPRPNPAILRINTTIRRNERKPRSSAEGSSQDVMYDERIATMSLLHLRMKLSEGAGPAVHVDDNDESDKKDEEGSGSANIVWNERESIIRLRKLLMQPRSAESQLLVIREAMHGIPDVLRADVWGCVLGVGLTLKSPLGFKYCWPVDATSRQIATDTPRCHPYNLVLASDAGQSMLHAVLMSWVHANPQLSYSQGLDSLCAPFVLLFLESAESALEALHLFIHRNMAELLRIDHSKPMQTMLYGVWKLIAFQDPQLASHLQSIHFTPNLYAVPWFLTWFSHMLPLDEVFPLWDRMLLGSASLPIFVAAAMVQGLRTLLLTLDFDECVTYFSQGPSFDVIYATKIAEKQLQLTPQSVIELHSVEDIHTDFEQVRSLIGWVTIPEVLQFGSNSLIIDARSKAHGSSERPIGCIHCPWDVAITTNPINQTWNLVVVAGDNHEQSFRVAEMLLPFHIQHLTVLVEQIQQWIEINN